MWSGRSPGPTPSQFLLRREGICDRLAPGSFLSFLAPCGPICITRLTANTQQQTATMTFDSFVTAAIVQEAQALVGAYVDHIAQPTERDLCVTFYPGRGKVRWLFSADPRQARVHR